jgi:hypothetical protein
MGKTMIYTDEDLTQFIACQKRIVSPPRKEMRTEGQMLRNEMELESIDWKHAFHAFMRQNRQFSENFSVGLDYLPKDKQGNFCLLRCNGLHGSHAVYSHHLRYHIHYSKAEDVNAGYCDARHIEQTGEYAAFRDALRYFLRRVNLQDTDLSLHFQRFIQDNLFKERDDDKSY